MGLAGIRITRNSLGNQERMSRSDAEDPEKKPFLGGLRASA